MIKNRTILALAVSGILLVGCDKKKDSAPPAPATPPPAAPVVPSALVPTLPVVPSVTPPTDTTPAVTPLVVPPVTPVTPPPATPTAPSASGDVNADAKATLAQFAKDLSAKDWKAAAVDVKTLNDEKDKLTPDLQDAVKKAQAELDIAKAAGGLKIPGLGGNEGNK